MLYSRHILLRTVTVLLLIVASLHPFAAKNTHNSKTAESVTLMLFEASRLEQKDSLVAAFDILRRCAAIDTSNAGVNYRLSMYYYKLNQLQTSYDYMLAAALKAPDNYWYNVNAANFAASVGDSIMATKLYNRLMLKNPDDEELPRMLADFYLKTGKYDEAISCYDRIEKITGNIEFVAGTKAEIFGRIGRKDLMLLELKRLAAAYPKNIDYLLMLSSGYLETDSLSASKRTIEKAEAIEPDNCYINISKAEYYDKKGEAENLRTSIYDALSCDALALEVKQELLRNYLYNLFQKDKDVKTFEKADTLFASLIDKYPREVSIRNFYADILLMQNNFDKAEEHLRVSLDLDNTNPEVWKKLVGTLYGKKEYDKMDTVINLAMPYAKNDSSFIITAGSYYFFAKQEDKAISMYKYAEDIYAGQPLILSDIYAQLGDIYYQIGNRDSSFAKYELSIQNNPFNLAVLNNYSYYLSISGGDLSKAEKMSAVTVSKEPENATYLDTYGWIFFKKGNYPLAELYIKRAINSGGEKIPDVLEHYGDILSEQGRTDDAVKYWKQAVEAGSTSATIQIKIKEKRYVE